MPKLWWFFGRYFTFFKFFSFCFFRFPTRDKIKFQTFKKRTVYKIGPQLFWWFLKVKTMRIKDKIYFAVFAKNTLSNGPFFVFFFLNISDARLLSLLLFPKLIKSKLITKKYPSLMPFFGQNMFKNQFLYFFCNALLCLFFF